MKKAISVFLALIMLLGVIGAAWVSVSALESDGSNYIVYSENDLVSACSEIGAMDSGAYTIKLGNDITVTKNVDFGNGNATVTVLGEDHTIFMEKGFFIVKSNAILNLGAPDYNKTLTLADKQPASGNAASSLIAVNRSVLNMYNGVTLSGRNGVDAAGGVSVENQSSFNMYGGTITGCKSDVVAGGVLLYNNCTFTMNGGSIENCNSVGDGAGVYAYNSAFTMNDGSIKNCNAGVNGGKPSGNFGGGVYANRSAFTMNGGSIENCSAGSSPNDGKGYGGGVYATSSSQFTMTAGAIKNCSSFCFGGGVFVYNSIFTMTDGEISGCSDSKNGGGGVLVGNTTGTTDYAFDMQGGEIKDCNADSGYGGGVLVYKGKARIMAGSKIYNNEALAAGDDIYSDGSTATLVLSDVPEGLILSETNLEIDGWYVDGAVDGEDKDRWDMENFCQKYTPSAEEIGTKIALKAAHEKPDCDYYNATVILHNEADGTDEVYFTGTTSSAQFTLPDEIKKGYTVDSTDYRDVTDPTVITPGSYTLIVNLVPTEYTVTFIADGKTVASVPYTVLTESISEPPVPEKEGCTGSWEPYELFINPETDGEPAGDIEVKAVYTANEYTITFIADGVKTEVKYKFGDSVKRPDDPVKDGYTFDGWDKEIPATMPAENLTVNAKFTPVAAPSDDTPDDTPDDKPDDTPDDTPDVPDELADERAAAKAELDKLYDDRCSDKAKDEITAAKEKIDNAKTAEEIETELQNGLKAVRAQREQDCPKCGLEHKGFLGMLVRFFHVILALLENGAC